MPEPTAFITALMNMGGLGIIAAILLYLHINTLKTTETRLQKIMEDFKEELAEERRICHEDHERILSSVVLMHQSLNSVCRNNNWQMKSQS